MCQHSTSGCCETNTVGNAHPGQPETQLISLLARASGCELENGMVRVPSYPECGQFADTGEHLPVSHSLHSCVWGPVRLLPVQQLRNSCVTAT